MQTADARAREAGRGLPLEPDHDPCAVEIVVPVFNEEADLAAERRAPARLPRGRRSRSRSASRSPTTRAPTGRGRSRSGLADALAGVRAVRLDAEGPRPRAAHGRGRPATPTVVAYMDVDLSTDLDALLPLVAPLLSGHSDVAIGTRLARSVAGGPRRQARGHLAQLQPAAARDAARPLLRRAVRVQGDPRATCARRLLPLVEDTGWFFDTELLVLAERGRAAHPRGAGRLDRRPRQPRRRRLAPRVADLRGMARRRRARSPPARCRWRSCAASSAARRWPPVPGVHRRCSASRCASRAIGVASTVAYLRALPAAARRARARRAPNLVALRRHGGRQHRGQPAAHLRRPRPRAALAATSCAACVVFALGLALTSGALAALHRRRRPTPRGAPSSPCSCWPTRVATVVRFLLLPRLGLPRAAGTPDPRRPWRPP